MLYLVLLARIPVFFLAGWLGAYLYIRLAWHLVGKAVARS